ncbi:protein translocase subunit SecD [Myceligenerans salitolerans]|uniref:Protein translocase subunit SecD n=1 Tax=Myceligenerans salitolerans TaxID=1230528 RepID=A0ABS3IC44_9MICO|nr:protein translocase subunit SecD [Myceligenerans salitolerans]MBO0610586.1 protein translocase subunit SecD [Myceligenerans salitolerans]
MTIFTMLLPLAVLVAGSQLDARSEENPDGASLAPALALDLQGGTQIVLQAVTSDGSEITPEAMDEAVGVIRQRVDANGVTEADIAVQGDRQIIVEIPGEVDDETIALISKAAQMKFRPVLTVGSPLATADPSAEAEGESGDEADSENADGQGENANADGENANADGENANADGENANGEGSAEEGNAATSDEELLQQIADEQEELDPTDPSDLAQITPAVQELADRTDCTDPANLEGGGGDNPNLPLVTCDQTGVAKYILGPVEVAGTELTSASSGLGVGANGVQTNEWVVNLTFNDEGTAAFRETTERLQSLESPRNQFAITLDGLVVSAPSLSPGVIITNGQAEISGTFTRDSAATLANQLSFGSLPLTFEVQSQNQISATLGTEQLQRGLFAGLIGLILVVVYSLFQYRTLGGLTIASLIVAGVMTYVVIALLSWGMGYRLSLPGVAGLIVAIGFTADSFIVYFERIRDELRDGRSLRLAVQRGWVRARRTIYAAKSVNLLSAIILYFMTVGGVRGFAFTLGLTTVIDILVVIWFTHPMMELLAKVPFFRDGHKWSGLSPDRLRLSSGGPRYKGAGRVEWEPGSTQVPSESVEVADEPAERTPAYAGAQAQSVPSGGAASGGAVPGGGAAPASATRAPDGRRMTIAERRAAERKAASEAAKNEEQL